MKKVFAFLFFSSLLFTASAILIEQSSMSPVVALFIISSVTSLAISTTEARLQIRERWNLLIKLTSYGTLVVAIRMFVSTATSNNPSYDNCAEFLLLSLSSWLLTLYLARIISVSILKSLSSQQAVSIRFLSNTLYSFLLLIIAASFLHIDMKLSIIKTLEGFAIITTALTLLAGLYFKEVIINLVHGLILNISPPFEIGDLIRAGDAYGFVVDNNWKYVKLKTWANESVYVPNTRFHQGTVTNLTKTTKNETDNYHAGLYLYTDPQHDPGWIQEMLTDALIRSENAVKNNHFKVKNVFLCGYTTQGAKYFIKFNLNRTCLYSNTHIFLSHVYKIFSDNGVQMTAGEMRTHLQQETSLRHPCIKEEIEKQDELIHKTGAVTRFSSTSEFFDPVNIKLALHRSGLFDTLSYESLQELAKLVKRKQFNHGQYIVKHNEHSGGIHIIRSGDVNIQNRKNQTIDTINAGEVIGEISTLTGEPATNSAVAVGHVVTLFIAEKPFLNFIKSSSRDTLEKLYAIIEQRMAMNREFSNTKKQSKHKKSLLEKVAHLFFGL